MADQEEADQLNSEAEAQDEQTVMPWLWGGVGALAVAAFITWMILWGPLHQPPHPPAAAPVSKPVDQHT